MLIGACNMMVRPIHACRYTRRAAHRDVDRGLGALHAVLMGFRSALPSGPYPENLNSDAYKEQLRACATFSKFDQAINRAESRLSAEDIAVWRAGKASGMCAICMAEIEADEDALVLPCTHIFHEYCILEWIHNYSSCPNCRRDLAKPAKPA